MFLRFCGTRCREKKGVWVQELFPTHPTYKNPILINPGPLLCKVSWFFGFSFFVQFSCFFLPYRTPFWIQRWPYGPCARTRLLSMKHPQDPLGTQGKEWPLHTTTHFGDVRNCSPQTLKTFKKTDQPVFKPWFFCEIWVSKKPGFVPGSPRGFIFPEMTPPKTTFSDNIGQPSKS